MVSSWYRTVGIETHYGTDDLGIKC